MKKLIYIPVLTLMASLLMVSCDGLLNVESERYTFDKDYRMGSDHDSLYAIVGILSELQKLGDRYVLLGELRGDLMETTDGASRFLKQMNDFTITKDNPYASVKEYYSVINNCNYAIQFVDTTARNKGDKPNHRVMAAAKSIRAWTYLQLVLNHGSANYIVNPILTSEDVNRTYESVNLSTLCDYLITDLLPFAKEEPLNNGVFVDFDSRKSLIPIRFLLGDLYLWKGSVLEGSGDDAGAKQHYLWAAQSYYSLMKEKELLISRQSYRSSWAFDEKTNLPTVGTLGWQNLFNPGGSTEILGALASSPEYGHPFTLDTLTFNKLIIPTALAVANWKNQLYYYDDYGVTDGDLRKFGSITTTFVSENTSVQITTEEPIISKHLLMCSNEKQKIIYLYRNAHLYLHYAEAINRLGYPRLAYEAMKSGLNPVTARRAAIRTETYDTTLKVVPAHLDFSTFQFTNNIGTKMRGLGNLQSDSTFYIIPANVDSIKWVEDELIEEMALEFAFEGSRFHDLMRVAIRRNQPAFLADRVSEKYTTNKAAIRSKLMDTGNWYLPQ